MRSRHHVTGDTKQSEKANPHGPYRPTDFHQPSGGHPCRYRKRPSLAQSIDSVACRKLACPGLSIMSAASYLAIGNLVWWMISGLSMSARICEEDFETLRLPRDWHSYVRSAVLNVVGIVRVAMLAGRKALITHGDTKDARIHQLESEVAMLREEFRINSARMQRVAPHRRRTDGHPATASDAWLEQSRNGSSLLCVRRHHPHMGAASQ